MASSRSGNISNTEAAEGEGKREGGRKGKGGEGEEVQALPRAFPSPRPICIQHSFLKRATIARLAQCLSSSPSTASSFNFPDFPDPSALLLPPTYPSARSS